MSQVGFESMARIFERSKTVRSLYSVATEIDKALPLLLLLSLYSHLLGVGSFLSF
jgi:hypothetical protein